MEGTVTQALEDAARATDRGLTFIGEDGASMTLSYAELLRRAQAVGAALQADGLRVGDSIALILPDAQDFIVTFFGAMCAGVVPVPLYPPLGLGKIAGYLQSSKHVVKASRARRVVTTGQIRRLLGTVQEAAPECTAVLDVAELRGDAGLFRAPQITPSHTAFIQFTSGSTARPKGVVLSHANLDANSYAIMHDALRSNEDDVGVSWLPLFHDMGLIGKVIAPITATVPVVYMPTLSFLKRPRAWLEAMARHRGTISFSPNFGYGLCAKRVKDAELEGLDLSAWRVAGCGAEPIQATTLDAFANRFRAAGFRREAYLPCYGMAEHTLAICFAPLGGGATTDTVRSASLWEHSLAEPGDEDQDGTARVVSCGRPLADHQVAILDEEGETLSERQVGEIALRGPSLMAGYFEAPDLTAAAFREGWFLTGDLGYFAQGELYVCGRKKDMIIVNGRNYYPQDIEWAVAEVDGVRTGSVVAFGSPAEDGSERLVVVAETREPAPRHAEIEAAVRIRVHEVVGLHPGDVRILQSGAVPKTTSGKLKRAETRALYEQGALGDVHETSKLELVKHLAQSQFSFLKATLRRGRSETDAA